MRRRLLWYILVIWRPLLVIKCYCITGRPAFDPTDTINYNFYLYKGFILSSIFNKKFKGRQIMFKILININKNNVKPKTLWSLLLWKTPDVRCCLIPEFFAGFRYRHRKKKAKCLVYCHSKLPVFSLFCSSYTQILYVVITDEG